MDACYVTNPYASCDSLKKKNGIALALKEFNLMEKKEDQKYLL